ncbi:hypothetical protein IPN41_04510 [Candidatus Falkowbacteria bacterium]|nr:MAG: hypothetical protein IPN41_04510 [Candidatus Falkowbacteria bacterium]
MKQIKNLFVNTKVIVFSACAAIFLFGFMVVQAGTTIGNDIATAGTLLVEGVTSLKGDVSVHNGNFVIKRQNNTEYVGIGTNNPSQSLEIYQGNLRFSGVMNPDIQLGPDVAFLNIRKYDDGTSFLALSERLISASAPGGAFSFSTVGDSYINAANGGMYEARFGVGTSTPTQRLEVNGGIKLNTTTSRPLCDSSVRGTFWFTQVDAGGPDSVTVCAKDGSGSYAWRVIY